MLPCIKVYELTIELDNVVLDAFWERPVACRRCRRQQSVGSDQITEKDQVDHLESCVQRWQWRVIHSLDGHCSIGFSVGPWLVIGIS